MRVIHVACVLYFLAGMAAASPAVSVPEVSSVVSSVTASFVAAVLYTGPTGWCIIFSQDVVDVEEYGTGRNTRNSSSRSNPILVGTDQASRNIPFNSNPSSYQVFRNVKDFGAKGW